MALPSPVPPGIIQSKWERGASAEKVSAEEWQKAAALG